MLGLDARINQCKSFEVMKDSNPSFAKAIQMLLGAAEGYRDLPLLSFDALFPEQGHLDRCLLVLSDVEPPELAGSYGVSDLYCQDPSCDCQKVSLVVFDDKRKVHATIAYGWKSKTFYRKWGLDEEIIPSDAGLPRPLGPTNSTCKSFFKSFLVYG